MCLMDKPGFPRTRAKGPSRVRGFQTGDLVRAVVRTGKKSGTSVGRVAVRATGSFNVTTRAGTIQGIPARSMSGHPPPGWLHLHERRGDFLPLPEGDGSPSLTFL